MPKLHLAALGSGEGEVSFMYFYGIASVKVDPGPEDSAEVWARLVSNQRPLACEASALPLSYAPWTSNSMGRGPSARR